MKTKIKFRIVVFKSKNGVDYICVTNDSLVDLDFLQKVEQLDSLLYHGPKAWAGDILEDIKQSLADIEVKYLLDINLTSPCYETKDYTMISNVCGATIAKFNKSYLSIQS